MGEEREIFETRMRNLVAKEQTNVQEIEEMKEITE